jgi:hypothetical protein
MDESSFRIVLLKTAAGQQIALDAKRALTWQANQSKHYKELRELAHQTFVKPPTGFMVRWDVFQSSLENIAALSHGTEDEYVEVMGKVKHAYDSANAYAEAIACLAPRLIPEYSPRVASWNWGKNGRPWFNYR